MNSILIKIGQLAIFLICAQTLIHFRPKASYEKYIRLLVSMMLLILLVEPIMDLLGKENAGDFLERIHAYEQELEGILVSPQLEMGEIETILSSITQQRVNEEVQYVQEEQAVSAATVNAENAQDTGKIEVEVEIEEIEIGADYGKSAKNP